MMLIIEILWGICLCWFLGSYLKSFSRILLTTAGFIVYLATMFVTGMVYGVGMVLFNLPHLPLCVELFSMLIASLVIVGSFKMIELFVDAAKFRVVDRVKPKGY